MVHQDMQYYNTLKADLLTTCQVFTHLAVDTSISCDRQNFAYLIEVVLYCLELHHITPIQAHHYETKKIDASFHLLKLSSSMGMSTTSFDN